MASDLHFPRIMYAGPTYPQGEHKTVTKEAYDEHIARGWRLTPDAPPDTAEALPESAPATAAPSEPIPAKKRGRKSKKDAD